MEREFQERMEEDAAKGSRKKFLTPGRPSTFADRTRCLGCDPAGAGVTLVRAPRNTVIHLPARVSPRVPTPHGRLVMDLGQTGPGRTLPQRQPRFQAAMQPPQFPKPRRLNLWPPPCHILAPDLGQHTAEEGTQPWTSSEWNHERLHRRCIDPL